ncbi:MAG: CocE/NonD family hydrolase C-terminal non-catalytic domain-containing protein, partial [Planctomycetota bacterium]|nr:CocE/NonD family hydrolase C-terminal non-catalytic domain-containing protein [Planctomycetota bacterium]
SQLAYAFPAGSRIALTVTSSDFPRIQPHSNTMAKPWVPEPPIIAHTDILHGAGIHSRLNLPVFSGV